MKTLFKVHRLFSHKNEVAGIFALAECSNDQSFGITRFKVLAGMYGHVDFMAEQGLFELLDRVYHEIDALEPSRVEMRSYTRWAEAGPKFLGAGLILLALDVLLGATWLRRYP